MKILKFGGKSLASDPSFKNILDIIKTRTLDTKVAVVVSAIGDTTDVLYDILNQAKQKKAYQTSLEAFKQRAYHQNVDIEEELASLTNSYAGVYLLEDYSAKIKDQVLAQGELIAIKVLAKALTEQGLKAQAVDSRVLLVTDSHFGAAHADEAISKKKTQDFFKSFPTDSVPILSGFIGQTLDGETTTIGRNGSNYSAALFANFLEAKELQNFTHVDGVFTANPEWVKNSKKIDALHFDEANEIASFGASILHAKTIQPLLEGQIPLRICNTLKPNNKGTLISGTPTRDGIKSISLEEEVALIQLEGSGLLGRVGVDAKVFTSLANVGVSVGMVSQGSSERGLGFIVAAEDAEKAEAALREAFEVEFSANQVNKVSIRKDIAVISIVGQDLRSFDKPYVSLLKNNISPILFNNAVTGKNVSLVVKKEEAKKALNVIHSQIFGVTKVIHLAIFGHGLVGATLIDQILESAKSIAEKKDIELKVFAIANSKTILLDADGIKGSWKEALSNEGKAYQIEDVVAYAKEHHLENLIAIDNTASVSFVENYTYLVNNDFNLVSSNKSANTLSFDFYKSLRETLDQKHKEYLYETNVGAGLPLIDSIKLLHLSGENITKIKGVFSGSLSYLFNTFSVEDKPFSKVLEEAISKGYTEPDPREDLSGNDVGRKLLVLARELDLQNEFDEIHIQNLIPIDLQTGSTENFLQNLESLDKVFAEAKRNLPKGSVLRYIGELSGNLQENKGVLETKLVEVPENSALGQLKGSDSIFEIYTESYGENPITIQGAGAGAAVTARGVLGDIIRLALK